MDFITNVIYNGSVFLAITVWFYFISHKNQLIKLRDLLLNLEGKYFYSICFAFAIPSFIFMVTTGLVYTDVDNAISSGAIAFLQGSNVFIDSVVEHMPNNVLTYGVYHYFPADLLYHAGVYLFVGQFIQNLTPFLHTYWFAIGYIPLLPVSIYVFKKLIDLPWSRALTIYLMFAQAFFFNNAFLTVTFFMIGVYLIYYKDQYHLGIIIWIFASSSKYITGIFVFFYFFRDIQTFFVQLQGLTVTTVEKIKLAFNHFKGYIVGSTLFFLLMIPFGIKNVLVGVFLYQGNLSERSKVAEIKGPLLVEILKSLNALSYYMSIFLFLVFVIIIFVFFKFSKKPYIQAIGVSTLIMLLFPYIGTELYAAPLFGLFFVFFNEDFSNKVQTT